MFRFHYWYTEGGLPNCAYHNVLDHDVVEYCLRINSERLEVRQQPHMVNVGRRKLVQDGLQYEIARRDNKLLTKRDWVALQEFIDAKEVQLEN